MSKTAILLSLVKADLQERMRRYSFLMVAGISLAAFYLFVPPAGSTFAVVEVAGYRGTYNSAWVGASVAMATVPVLFLLGFYLVKNAVDNDIRSGVGQLIASSPLSKLMYLTAKFLSNSFILSALVMIAFLTSILMQLIRGENMTLVLSHLALPFLVVALPAILVVAALAVFFESTPLLRGGLGNVLYFFLWILILSTDTSRVFYLGGDRIPIYSLMGGQIFRQGMANAVSQFLPGIEARVADGLMLLEEPLKTFVWEGVNWSPALAVGRLPWLALAVGVVLLASPIFRGFDTRAVEHKESRLFSRWKKKTTSAVTVCTPASFAAGKLTPVRYKPSFADQTAQELKLLLSGLPWWWYAVQVILMGLCLLAPLHLAQRVFGPLAWSWPLLVWSSLGHAEFRYRTADLLFSCPNPVKRRTMTLWVAGFALTALAGSAMAVRLIISSQWIELSAWLVGAMFIPALALALSTWTRSGKTFEITYMLMIYLVFNGVAVLDFMGAVPESSASGMPLYYLGATLVLLAATAVGRKVLSTSR